ncbi:MAG: hypothetical protein R3322_16970 [Kiloniellales bacterium]|jgi:hypothetical protein|nr:hypothetical protein [Kiloniellales bacterium]
MEFLTPILQHEVIVALAVVGVVAATAGSYILGRGGRDGRASGPAGGRVGRFILRSGYACTCGSIVIFIVAGFVGT